MKAKLLKFCVFTLLLVTSIGFTSCEDQDDNAIYSGLIDNTYFGDLYFYYDEYPVESYITFKTSDYAIDEQYYFDNGNRATTLDLRWWVSNGTLYLDYGKYLPMLEIRNIVVGGLYLHGDLYSDGAYVNRIELERER